MRTPRLAVRLQVGAGGWGDCELESLRLSGVEVSPTVSYAGEGLQDLCAERVLRQAYDVFLQVCSRQHGGSSGLLRGAM